MKLVLNGKFLDCSFLTFTFKKKGICSFNTRGSSESLSVKLLLTLGLLPSSIYLIRNFVGGWKNFKENTVTSRSFNSPKNPESFRSI